MHRAPSATRSAWLKSAAFAGLAIRKVGENASDLVGACGAALVSIGAGQIYTPLMPIVAGAFLLTIARNLR